MTEDCVDVVEVGCGLGRYEELGPVCVRTLVGHRQQKRTIKKRRMFHVFFFFNNSNFKITARQGLNKFNQLKGLWAKDHSEPGISHQGNIILLLPLPSLREEKSKLLRKRRGEKKEKGKGGNFFLPEAHLTFTRGKRIQT